MKAQHTPGPWFTEDKYRNGSPLPVFAAGSLQIADCGGQSGAETPEENEANIRLICAAPELFAALQSLSSLFPCGHETPVFRCAGCDARAAIAKALEQ